MKILFIGPCGKSLGGSNFGGVAQYISNFSNTLRECGSSPNCNYGLLATGKYKSFNSKMPGIFPWSLFIRFKQSVVVLYALILSLNRIGTRKLMLKNIYLALRLVFSRVNLSSWDVIHVHGFDNIPFFLFGKLQRKYGLKVVLTIHSYHLYEKEFDERCFKDIQSILNNVNTILHVSKSDLKKALSYGFKLDDENVLYNFVNISPLMLNADFYQRRKDFLFVGSNIPRKRLDLTKQILFDYFSNIRLNVIGCLNTNSDSGNVIYRGKMENRLVYEYYSSSELLIVPSVSESFGLVYIESILNGCRVYGYDSIIKEFLSIGFSKNSICGALKTNETKQHAKIIKEFLNESYSYEEYEKDYFIITENFSFVHHLNKLENIYNSLYK